MKRSEIDAYIEQCIAFLNEQNFHLPKWAYWSAQDWAHAGPEADEIRDHKLGWDVTDFGGGNYDSKGLLMFTIRNGLPAGAADPMAKDYCEKILLVRPEQLTPTHFHWSKMEDIINRAGGRLVLQLWNADRDSEGLDEQSEVVVSIDGIRRTLPPGGEVVLEPGESITLGPYLYHNFYSQQGHGTVLAGEVSRVNDDERDNRFLEPLPRFPQIEPDVPPRYLLCTEYPPAAQ